MAESPLIPATWQLPESIRRRLGSKVGMQRVIYEEENLVIVAHDVPAPTERVRRGILIWRKPDGTWSSSNGELGNIAIEKLLQKYDQAITKFESAEARANKADAYLKIVEALAPVSRSLQNFSNVMKEARKQVPDATELIDLRDRAYELARSAQLNYQMTRDEMDVAMIVRGEEHSRIADRMAQASHRLNMMAAFFLPLATISGVFGTTLTDNWSWSSSVVPFLLMITLGLLAGFVCMVMFQPKSADGVSD